MTEDYVDNATTFNSNDAPNRKRLDGSETLQEKYNRLETANKGLYNGKWRDEERATVKHSQAILDAVASTLELTDHQHTVASNVFQSLPDYFDTAYSTRLVALCVCGHIGNRDGRDYHPNGIHPTYPSDHVDDSFVDIADDIGVSYSALYKCWHRVEGEL